MVQVAIVRVAMKWRCPGNGRRINQGYAGTAASEAAATHSIQVGGRQVAESEARIRAFASPLGVERTFTWAVRFRGLARNYERLPHTMAGLRFLALAYLMLPTVMLFPTLISNRL